MPDFINTIDVLGDDAVIGSIINRTITEFKDDAITKVGVYAFCECTALTVVDLPNVAALGTYSFQKCSTLESVNLPATSLLYAGVFDSCTALVNVNIPLLTSFAGGSVFKNCTSLKSARFPLLASVTSGTEFDGCTSLEIVDSALIRIRPNMFRNCSALQTLIIRADTVCTFEYVNAFSATPIANGTGYVYVPRALVDSYKAATNWSQYASQIRAIEDYPEITGG